VVVGAGPSGFYAADQLLRAGFSVDLLDALPTPYGLVRAGVAPDHPKIKSVTRVFDRTAARDGFRFHGGVELGVHVTRAELLSRYHAVVYAMGAAMDRRMDVTGEDRPGSHAATEFVAWYNGHPDHATRSFDLTTRRAVVIGNGNVALDVARMLVLSREELALTDTADHALEALSRSSIEEVVVIGRRGPAEAAFTHPELRELFELDDAELVVHDSALGRFEDPEGLGARRNLDLLTHAAGRPARGARRRVELRFLRSPVELVGDGRGGRVTGVRLGINRLERGVDGTTNAVSTGDHELLECGLVLRAIGYRSAPVDGVPFDNRLGRIPNLDGRLVGSDGVVAEGEYAVGWIKRGPSGVIGTNKKDAAETVSRILEDRDAGRLNRPVESAPERGWPTSSIGWSGWEAIDRHELAEGSSVGRPRVKVVHVDRMREIAGTA
jgi:ferredoxin--NADP+ reductase